MNVVAKSTNLSPFLKAVSAAVQNPLSPPRPTIKAQKLKFLAVQPVIGNTSQTLHEKMFSGPVSVRTGISVSTQVIQKRLAHTDIRYPDFTVHRKESCKDPTVKHKVNDEGRKAYSYMMFGGTIMTGTYAIKTIVTTLATTWAPAANLMALSKIEINLNAIPEGKNAVFKWRGKPVFVRHRTQGEIANEDAVNISELRDPQADSDRVKFKEWLVVIGVCTHLGCVPIANAGSYGGYYCPCHGSHYDASGRIRKGPAPLNLEIPEHTFTEEGTLIVG